MDFPPNLRTGHMWNKPFSAPPKNKKDFGKTEEVWQVHKVRGFKQTLLKIPNKPLSKCCLYRVFHHEIRELEMKLFVPKVPEVNILFIRNSGMAFHCKSNARTRILTDNCLFKAIQAFLGKQIHKLYLLFCFHWNSDPISFGKQLNYKYQY